MLKSSVFVIAVLCIMLHCNFLIAKPQFYGEEESQMIENKEKLIFSNVLYRHGDRTIHKPYKNDPWKVWPQGFGQLTDRGMQQHYLLGKWLRKRYNSLLSKKYNRSEIYIQSTDVDRTLMSALANLAGLYEPDTKESWSNTINWQPIPVHTTSYATDKMEGNPECPAYVREYLNVKRTIQNETHERFKDLYSYLSKNVGQTVDSFSQVHSINNTLFIESLFNKTLPEWTKKVYGDSEMTYATNFAFAMPTLTRKLARLKIGPLISEILQRFNDKVIKNLRPDRSVWVYSGHDTTIAHVLNALKMFDPPHSPPYAACIMLELYLDADNAPFVKIFYKTTNDEPQAMQIPDCGFSCPLSKMFTLYDDILPKNLEAECNIPEDGRNPLYEAVIKPTSTANRSETVAIVMLILLFLVLILSVACLYFTFLRDSKGKHYFQNPQVVRRFLVI